jgi:hypothetical protein
MGEAAFMKKRSVGWYFIWFLFMAGCRHANVQDDDFLNVSGAAVFQEMNLKDYQGFVKKETGLQMLHGEEIFYSQEFQEYTSFDFLHVPGQSEKMDIEALLGQARSYRLLKSFYAPSLERINYYLDRISPDGRRALIITVENGSNRVREEIVDLESNRRLFEYDYRERDLAPYEMHQFTPGLDGYLETRGSDLVFVRLQDGEEFLLPIRLDDNYSIYDLLFSADNAFLSYLKYPVTEEGIYSKDEILQICVIDVETGEETAQIPIGAGSAQLSQWHASGKIFYNLNEKGYLLDLESKSIVFLGDWVFRPALSPDEAYIAYLRPIYEHVNSLCDDDQIEVYEAQNEYGLYLMDLSNRNSLRLSEVTGEDIDLVDWINWAGDRPKPSLKSVEGKPWEMLCPAIVEASSSEPEHSPELVLDRNYTTAWIEGADGDGLQEWLQISFVEYNDRGERVPLTQPIWNMAISPCVVDEYSDFYAHNRIHMLRIELSDGSEYIEELIDDEEDFMQGIWFDQVHPIQWIRLTVMSVYPGETQYQTGITEIHFNYS